MTKEKKDKIKSLQDSIKTIQTEVDTLKKESVLEVDARDFELAIYKLDGALFLLKTVYDKTVE
jgi:hypothetical protein